MIERRTSEQMYPIISKYETGELSRQQCCDEHNLNEGVFWYWLGKYRKESKKGKSFIEIDIDMGSGKTMEVSFPSGKVLRFYGYPSVAYLTAIMGS